MRPVHVVQKSDSKFHDWSMGVNLWLLLLAAGTVEGLYALLRLRERRLIAQDSVGALSAHKSGNSGLGLLVNKQ